MLKAKYFSIFLIGYNYSLNFTGKDGIRKVHKKIKNDCICVVLNNELSRAPSKLLARDISGSIWKS